MSLVLDTSAALAWIYAEETTTAIRELYYQVFTDGAWVPSLWHLEIANVLEINVRRHRHDAAFRDATLTELALLPILIDPDTNLHAWKETAHLADRHRLTLYDAAYLELAMRRNLPLATLDRELRKAALTEQITVLGE